MATYGASRNGTKYHILDENDQPICGAKLKGKVYRGAHVDCKRCMKLEDKPTHAAPASVAPLTLYVTEVEQHAAELESLEAWSRRNDAAKQTAANNKLFRTPSVEFVMRVHIPAGHTYAHSISINDYTRNQTTYNDKFLVWYKKYQVVSAERLDKTYVTLRGLNNWSKDVWHGGVVYLEDKPAHDAPQTITAAYAATMDAAWWQRFTVRRQSGQRVEHNAASSSTETHYFFVAGNPRSIIIAGDEVFTVTPKSEPDAPVSYTAILMPTEDTPVRYDTMYLASLLDDANARIADLEMRAMKAELSERGTEAMGRVALIEAENQAAEFSLVVDDEQEPQRIIAIIKALGARLESTEAQLADTQQARDELLSIAGRRLERAVHAEAQLAAALQASEDTTD